jgi:Arc/MetJ-type ribon-helix-helix transcriptional regulator
MKYARISAKIPSSDKEKIRSLVKKGLFTSMSEFHELAARRLIRDLETYREKKQQMKERALGKTQERIKSDMEEIGKFVDDLF